MKHNINVCCDFWINQMDNYLFKRLDRMDVNAKGVDFG